MSVRACARARACECSFVNIATCSNSVQLTVPQDKSVLYRHLYLNLTDGLFHQRKIAVMAYVSQLIVRFKFKCLRSITAMLYCVDCTRQSLHLTNAFVSDVFVYAQCKDFVLPVVVVHFQVFAETQEA